MEKKSLYIMRDTNGVKEYFPSSTEKAVIGTYTYDAQRMGGAPTFTATLKFPRCLDNEWTLNEYIEFGGEKYYIRQKPSSSKDNSEITYKHEVTFVSEREILENVYFLDVVTEDTEAQYKDRYRSNTSKVHFYGDVHEFVARLNDSLIYSGLYNKDTQEGFHIVIDEGITSEGKDVSIEDKFIAEALQDIYNVYGLAYYWTGKTCHVGYTENVITTPIGYGSDNALLSVQKTNANYRIITRITGTGGTKNLPWYYPNLSAEGNASFDTENIDKSEVADISLNEILKYNSSPYTAYRLKKVSNTDASADIGQTAPFYNAYSPTVITSREATDTFYFGTGIGNSYIKIAFRLKINAQEGDKLRFVFNESFLTFRKISGDADLSLSWQKVSSNSYGGDRNLKNTISIGIWRDDYNPNEDDSISDKIEILSGWKDYEYTFHSSGWFQVVVKGIAYAIFSGSGATNSQAIIGMSLNAKSSITYQKSGGELYYFSYGDGNNIAYSKSGITLSDVNNVPYAPSHLDFSGGEWNVVEDSGDHTPAIINITGREWITPSQSLMPSIYRESGGAERYYNAVNNTYEDESGNKYIFNNVYNAGNPREGTTSFEDIVPTIKGIKNIQGQLIGEIADIRFDTDDSDVLKDNSDEYLHSYFYIKLHVYNGSGGFNIFEHALESEEAAIEMTSGNCAACRFVIGVDKYVDGDRYKFYNPVMTDAQGNLRKVNSSNADKYEGDYILPSRDTNSYVSRQQDTSAYEVWIAVKKETDTFGVIMPNAAQGYRPSIGDTFVITGISLPESYIREAEKRLDAALIAYMKGNNDEKFTYSIKFSRVYLALNEDFTSLLNENTRLTVRYNQEEHLLYVSNYTCKADDSILYEISVDLTDTLTVSQSSFRAQLDSIKTEILTSLTYGMRGDILAQCAKYFLRKDSPDTALDIITFLKGLLVGDGDYGIDADGTARLKKLLADEATMKTLTVTGRAHFFELVIDELNSVGGQLILSAANCTVRSVERISGAWRLWWLAEDSDGRAVQNMWKVGDQALAMTSNLAEGTSYDAGNRLWWRLVTATGSGTRNIDGEDRKCHWIEVSEATCAADSLEPAEGDSVCLCGHRGDDTARSHAIIIAAHSTPDTELESPSFAQYNGITSFSLSQYRTTWFAANGNKIRGELDVDTSGLVSYTHLAWGNGPEDWTKDKSQSTAKEWLMLGICTDRTESDVALVYSDYAWSRIKGTDGKDGTSFTVKGSVDDESMLPPTGNSTGDAYLVNGYLWVWDGSAWANAGKIQGPAGEDGADGKTTYFHIRYSPNPDGVPMSETPDVFIGTRVDFDPTASDNPSDYTWARFRGMDGQPGEKGDTGPQGVPGPSGEDGKTLYTWIRYADTAEGGGISNDPSGKKYIGFAYNKNTAQESDNPSDYTWSEIKGEDGVPGAKGEDGETLYTWIAYSDSPDGEPMYQTPSDTTKYIGIAVNKESAQESDNPSDYTWSKFRGEDGTSFNLKGSKNDSSELPQDGNAVGDAWLIDGDLWVWDGDKWVNAGNIQGPQGPQGEQGIPGVAGKDGAPGHDGKTTYFHVKYSSNSNGTPMTETPNLYIGTYVDFTEADSDDPSDYTWSRFQGYDGEQGIPGTNGADGLTYYLHIKYSDDGGKTFTANNGETPGAWIGVMTDTNADDSTDPSEYTWSKIKGDKGDKGDRGEQGLQGLQGPQGEQGIPGTPGADGRTSYFHIKYSANANGTPMTETPDKYIGTYVDFTETDSTDASDYTWSRFEGIQGEQGLPGVNGTDGTTYYLHIKYSNDGGVTFTGNNGEDSGDWIGVLTDTNPTDSGTPSDYKWSKIKGDTGEKGDKGEQGVPGPAGEDGRTTYFHVKYSANSNGTPMTETPNLYIGTYVDFTEADSDDPSDYTWSRFQGYDGEQGIPGTNGADGKTSYLHIKYSDDGGKTFTANNGETPGAWLGQCVDFNPYDPTSVTSYKWTRIRGEDGADGSDGEPGTDGQDGFSWALDPAAITLEADSDGVVSMQDATSRLRAWLGTREMTVTITAIEPVHCLASRNGAQVTITAIGTYTADWGGSVPYGAGWVQITAQATLGGETRSVSCRLSFTVSSIALSSQIKAETDSISLKVGYLGAKDGNMVTTPDIFLTGNGNKVYTIGDVSSLRGKTITVSCLVKTVSAVPAASGNRRIGMEPMVRYADGSTQYLGTWRQITSTDTFEGRISSTHRIQDKAVASVEQRNLYIQGISSGYASVSRPKIETGADATDWGLSAEDRLKRPNLLPGTSDFSQCTVQDTVEAEAYTTPYGEKISVAHGVNEAGTSYKDVITWRNVVPEPGVQYTLSFWARGTGSIGSYFYPNCTDWVTSPGTKNQTGVTDGFVQFTLESGWNRYQVTWSTRNDVSGGKSLIAARLMPDSSAQGEVWICGVKLEKGSEATDWRSETITRDELQATGIDIEHKRIKVTADNFEIQNNSGETVTTIDEAGTLTGVMLRTMDEGQGHVEIKGGLIEVKNPNGVTNIKMGYNGSYMVLSYYDNDGTFLYDLGPWGLSGKDVSEERWETSSKYGRLQLTGTTFSTVGDIVGNKQIMNTIFQYGHVYTKTPLYMYLAGRVNDTYLSGDYASTAEIARAANGRWFMEQGNVTTAQAVTGMWAQDNPESFMIGSPMDTPPMDYTRYEDDYAEKVDFSKQWCSRNVYRFSNIGIVQPGSGTVYYGSMITTTAVYMNYDRVQMIQINRIDDDDTDTNGNIYL